MNWRYITSP